MSWQHNSELPRAPEVSPGQDTDTNKYSASHHIQVQHTNLTVAQVTTVDNSIPNGKSIRPIRPVLTKSTFSVGILCAYCYFSEDTIYAQGHAVA